MTIRVTCNSCEMKLSVKDTYAGRVVKCPHCEGKIKLPAVNVAANTAKPRVLPTTTSPTAKVTPPAPASAKKSPATAASDPNQLMREILGSFQGEFPRVIPTIGYRLAALVVAGVMILLPLIYIALIGVFAYLLYWHATANVVIFSAARGLRTTKGAVFLYAGPLVIGGVLILFMIKPLFARRPKRDQEVVLSVRDEPILHSFVHRLCVAVNAPVPKTVEVDCSVNAGAFFRGGLWSVLSNDLGLQIGLPLVSGLNTRQLAGVLAHELGHFSQGAGMRLSYLIRNINGWFARVIYERDEWDEFIESWREHESGGLIVLGMLINLFVWLTRRILWVLMAIGHGVSCLLLRQMEYDADKYEARLAGSDVFEATSRRMVELSLAEAISQTMLVENWERAGLPDNLPLCLSKVARKLPPALKSIPDDLIKNETTSWFASHPATRDRIVAAHRQQAEGIFQLERPARVLLKNYAKVSESATLLFYQRLIGRRAAQRQLTPTETFLTKVGFDRPANYSADK